MADPTGMTKAQLLAELHAEQAGYEALLGAIGETHMTEPGVAADWSVKDVVAHLTGWRRRTVGRLRAARRGERSAAPEWPAHLETDDEINAWIYAANRDRPLADVLADSHETFERFIAALDAFSEEELRQLARVLWPEGSPISGATFFEHYHVEHEADLRAWLAKIEREQEREPPGG